MIMAPSKSCHIGNGYWYIKQKSVSTALEEERQVDTPHILVFNYLFSC